MPRFCANSAPGSFTGSTEWLLFETLLTWVRDRQLVRECGRQRTDSTYVLAAVRALNRLVGVWETLRHCSTAWWWSRRIGCAPCANRRGMSATPAVSRKLAYRRARRPARSWWGRSAGAATRCSTRCIRLPPPPRACYALFW